MINSIAEWCRPEDVASSGLPGDGPLGDAVVALALDGWRRT